MKEIKLGLFFGHDIVLKSKDGDEEHWQKMWQNWLANEKFNAVDHYKEMRDLSEIKGPWDRYKQAWQVILGIK